MKWSKRLAEIEALRRKYGKVRPIQFPDLKVEQRTAPCSNLSMARGGSTAKKELPADAKQFPIGHSHKQGLTLITPGAIQNGELEWMGGKKS